MEYLAKHFGVGPQEVDWEPRYNIAPTNRSPWCSKRFCFEVGDGVLFAYAGFGTAGDSRDGNLVESCTILTTIPNRLLADVHDRMPVILSPDDYDLWLDPGMTHTATAVDLLRSYDATLMNGYPVSARVNAVANDDAECSMRIDIPQPTPLLFD